MKFGYRSCLNQWIKLVRIWINGLDLVRISLYSTNQKYQTEGLVWPYEKTKTNSFKRCLFGLVLFGIIKNTFLPLFPQWIPPHFLEASRPLTPSLSHRHPRSRLPPVSSPALSSRSNPLASLRPVRPPVRSYGSLRGPSPSASARGLLAQGRRIRSAGCTRGHRGSLRGRVLSASASAAFGQGLLC